MKNLVIHPNDCSTTFLKSIYGKAQNKTVIEGNSTPNKIEALIKRSDRVLMMGHGSCDGLFSMRLFSKHRKWNVISRDEANILRDKTQNIYIWCNADKYVEGNDLHGFYSGMFVSEVGEAWAMGLGKVSQNTVNESNYTFAEIVGDYIGLHIEDLYEKVMDEYGELAMHNPVAQYNIERIFVR